MFENAKAGDRIFGQVCAGHVVSSHQGPKGGLYAAVQWDNGRYNPKVNLRGSVWSTKDGEHQEFVRADAARLALQEPIEVKVSLGHHFDDLLSQGKYVVTITNLTAKQLRELHNVLGGGENYSELTEAMQEQLTNEGKRMRVSVL
jgi:hypothetical protein